MDYLQKAYISNLNAVCREGGHFSLQPGQEWCLREHTASFHKFYFFLSGQCRITIEGVRYTACAGDWFFIPAGVRHSYTHLPDQCFEKHWIHFDLYPNDSLPQLLQLPHRVCTGSQKEPEAVFEQLTKANSSNKLSDTMRAKAALMTLLAHYVEFSHSDDLPVLSEDDRRISEVLTYIHKHLAEPLTNRDLAALCHLHPNHFIRFFSQKTGQSPANYVMQCRMELARQLLIQSDLPISRIAEQVGLSDQSHFARLFRNFYAMSPSLCRKQHKPPT